MFPIAGVIGALAGVAGGMLAGAGIQRATEEKLRQLRRQRDEAVGKATAIAGASGAEMTSSAIQLHLTKMRQQFDLAADQVNQAATGAQMNSWISTMGNFASSFAGNLGGMGSDAAPKPDLQTMDYEFDWALPSHDFSTEPNLKPGVYFGRP